MATTPYYANTTPIFTVFVRMKEIILQKIRATQVSVWSFFTLKTLFSRIFKIGVVNWRSDINTYKQLMGE